MTDNRSGTDKALAAADAKRRDERIDEERRRGAENARAAGRDKGLGRSPGDGDPIPSSGKDKQDGDTPRDDPPGVREPGKATPMRDPKPRNADSDPDRPNDRPDRERRPAGPVE